MDDKMEVYLPGMGLSFVACPPCLPLSFCDARFISRQNE